MRVAIISARWPDVELERGILGLTEGEIARNPGATREGILVAASDAEVILTGLRPRFDAATIERLRCWGIVRYGAGRDKVDVAAAQRKGMAVAYVPDYGTEAVGVHAVSLALALLRSIPRADRLVKAGGWDLAPLRPLHLLRCSSPASSASEASAGAPPSSSSVSASDASVPVTTESRWTRLRWRRPRWRPNASCGRRRRRRRSACSTASPC